MGNKNSSSKSKVHGKASKAASTEPHHVPMQQGKPSTKTNMVGFSTETRQHGIGVHSEQQYKGPLDNDDTFTDFIRRAKYKIRTVTMSKSNVGRDQQSNTPPAPAPAPAPDEAYGSTTTNSKENQKDQFSEFIQLAKKRLRTTSSSIGKNGSSKRGLKP